MESSPPQTTTRSPIPTERDGNHTSAQIRNNTSPITPGGNMSLTSALGIGVSPATEMVKPFDPFAVKSRTALAKTQQYGQIVSGEPLLSPSFDQYLGSSQVRASSAVKQPPFRGSNFADPLTPIQNLNGEIDYFDERAFDEELRNLNEQLDKANKEDDNEDLRF